MQRAAAEVSRRRSDAGPTMTYGTGIATGPAVVDHLGSQRRLDYTAIGDTPVFEELEPVMVKGRAKPIVVYKVVGLREDAA